ncbi:MAG: response regulator [Leptospira sp.]|nr:response regulator [Leptospira sp.]
MEVFVVEDDEICKLHFIRLLEKKLKIPSIISFSNGLEAVEHVNNLLKDDAINNVSLIFLDLNMPVMDGWEFLDVITARSWNIPVCIVTSSIDPYDISKAKEYSNVIDYITKPATEDKIKDVLNKL